jgi:hypothetical protein
MSCSCCTIVNEDRSQKMRNIMLCLNYAQCNAFQKRMLSPMNQKILTRDAVALLCISARKRRNVDGSIRPHLLRAQAIVKFMNAASTFNSQVLILEVYFYYFYIEQMAKRTNNSREAYVIHTSINIRSKLLRGRAKPQLHDFESLGEGSVNQTTLYVATTSSP